MKKSILFIVIMTIFAACSKDKDKANGFSFNTKEYNININDKSDLDIKLSDITISDISFVSKNQYVANVNSTGTITPLHPGTTTILATYNGYSEECTVNVNGEYDYVFSEPYQQYGSSFDDVKKYEKRTLYESTDSSLVYNGDTKYVIMTMYSFEDKKLEGSSVAFIATTSNASLLGKCTAERYEYIGSQGYNLFYSNENSYVVANISISYILFVYIDKTTISTYSTNESLIEELDKRMNLYLSNEKIVEK